jgi:hypothetical protein
MFEEAMTWTARTDVGPNERCFVGTHADADLNRKTFGYVQEYANGTAAYWRQPMDQAKAAPSLDAAKKLAAQWAFPLAVVCIDDQGHEELSGRYHEGEKEDPQYKAMEEAVSLASAVLQNIRQHDGFGSFGNPALAINMKLKISNVRIYANDRTVLVDYVV